MPDLRTLHPAFEPYARAFFDYVHAYDSTFTVTSARRSTAQQTRLYQDWLAGKPGVFGALPPGRSQHERGLAFDLARYGRPPKEDELLAAAGALWRSLGGVWGGERDPVHFEAPKTWTGRG